MCEDKKESRMLLPGWGTSGTLGAKAARASSTRGSMALVTEDF